MTDKAAEAPAPELPQVGQNAPERLSGGETAAQEAQRAKPAPAKDAPKSELIGDAVDRWIFNIRSNANPISRSGEASNFLFEQAASLKSALSKAL